MSRARLYTVLATTTVASLASAGSAGAGSGPQPLPGQYKEPPRAVAESRGHEITAAFGSFCWGIAYDNHTGLVTCADMAGPITSKEQLPVRGKRIVHIDLGIPAEGLTAMLDDQPLRGPRRSDPSGRYWALRLPRRLSPINTLSLGADFRQGDVPYVVTLRRVKK